MPGCLCVCGAGAGGEAAKWGDAAHRQWRAGEGARAAGQPDYGEGGVKEKARALSPVNPRVVAGCCPDAITGESGCGEAAEREERGRFVRSKAPQRWWWPAIEHLTGGA
jgi:hypothetical protein